MTQESKDWLARINVVGTSGSGKSTFSKKLAAKLGYPRIEMDTLYWAPNWTPVADSVFMERIAKSLEQPRWVLDGNYDRTASLKWQNATCVIWLDYSFSRNLYQSLTRAFKRAWSQEELWPGTGNKESIRRSLFSKDSIILWMLKSHGKMRERYASRMVDPKFSHIKFVRLKSPKEASDFLASL